MSRKKISQRDARAFKAEAERLRRQIRGQRARFAQEYVGGVEIARTEWPTATDAIPTAIRTAHALSHAVVVVGDQTGYVRFIALPHISEPV